MKIINIEMVFLQRVKELATLGTGEIGGSVAALEHPANNDALNYGEIFLRDNVPVMIYLLTQKRYEIVKQFLVSLTKLDLF